MFDAVVIPTTRPVCRSCQRRKVTRPRGLCFRCFYSPGVWEKFPSTSKFARHGVGNGCRPSPLPAEPTRARPGSDEKLLVLAARAAAGESLFHPADGPVDD